MTRAELTGALTGPQNKVRKAAEKAGGTVALDGTTLLVTLNGETTAYGQNGREA